MTFVSVHESIIALFIGNPQAIFYRLFFCKKLQPILKMIYDLTLKKKVIKVLQIKLNYLFVYNSIYLDSQSTSNLTSLEFPTSRLYTLITKKSCYQLPTNIMLIRNSRFKIISYIEIDSVRRFLNRRKFSFSLEGGVNITII